MCSMSSDNTEAENTVTKLTQLAAASMITRTRHDSQSLTPTSFISTQLEMNTCPSIVPATMSAMYRFFDVIRQQQAFKSPLRD